MRAWFVIALIACGHDRGAPQHELAQGSAAAVPTSDAKAATTDDDIGRRIADELVKLPDNRLVYLYGLGWIQIKTYYPHVRTTQTGSALPAPGNKLPYWTPDPTLAAEVAHQPPPPAPAAWRDERGRYMAAIHDGDQDPPGEDPDLDVVRLDWNNELTERVHRQLVDELQATIPHVGHLAVAREPSGAHVVFDAAPELVQRLNAP